MSHGTGHSSLLTPGGQDGGGAIESRPGPPRIERRHVVPTGPVRNRESEDDEGKHRRTEAGEPRSAGTSGSSVTWPRRRRVGRCRPGHLPGRLAAAPEGDTPGRCPATHLRWRERRGILVAGWQRDRLPVDAPAIRMRPDLPPVSGTSRRDAPGVDGLRPDDLCVFHRRRSTGDLLVHPSCRAGLPAITGPVPGLRLGAVRHLRDLQRAPRRERVAAADGQRRLRRRGDRLPPRWQRRLHLDP